MERLDNVATVTMVAIICILSLVAFCVHGWHVTQRIAISEGYEQVSIQGMGQAVWHKVR